MNGEYLRVTPDELARALKDPEWALDLAENVQDSDEELDLDDVVSAGEPEPGQVPVLLSTLDVSALLPAARDARAKLLSEGLTVSRDSLARQLRADGHAASNSRVSAVLRVLAQEEAAA